MRNKITTLLLIATFGITAIPGLAHAQHLTLDRVAQQNEVGVQTGAALFSEDVGEKKVFRTDVFGSVGLIPNAGVYFNLPISHLTLEGMEDQTELGNAELGGFYSQTLDNLSVIYRLGLSLPTASDDQEAVLTNVASTHARITDFALSNPNYLVLRASASPKLKLGMFFVRGDLGIDTAVATEDRDNNDTEAILRANVAAGVEIANAVVAAELANTGMLTEDGDFNERFLHTAAVSASYDFGPVALLAGVSTPLDDNARGEVWVPTLAIRGQF